MNIILSIIRFACSVSMLEGTPLTVSSPSVYGHVIN